MEDIKSPYTGSLRAKPHSGCMQNRQYVGHSKGCTKATDARVKSGKYRKKAMEMAMKNESKA